jgi:Rhodopirellula transposase DDE domain/Glycosyl hydrolases family 31
MGQARGHNFHKWIGCGKVQYADERDGYCQPMLPPRWAFGYHHCRWGYERQSELTSAVENMEKHNIPVKAFHLDIDCLDHFEPFTVSGDRFPDIQKIAQQLAEKDIQLITGPTKWLRRSLRGLKAILAGCGALLSHMSIRRLLKQQKYSLKVNRKSVASTQNPQRDQQFRYIRRVRKLFTQAGHPVISVDTKKKELIGNFKNAGETWNQEADGGALFRLRLEDFQEIQHYDGTSPAWCISYDDLEPYYTQAERLYKVHGQRGIDPTEPYIAADYPASPIAHSDRIAQTCCVEPALRHENVTLIEGAKVNRLLTNLRGTLPQPLLKLMARHTRR